MADEVVGVYLVIGVGQERPNVVQQCRVLQQFTLPPSQTV